jgi:hypothetical protein
VFHIGLEPEEQKKLKCVRCGFISLFSTLLWISIKSRYSLTTLIVNCQDHPWFRDVVWERLYETEAAFKPRVVGELDTQNFMKFDEV